MIAVYNYFSTDNRKVYKKEELMKDHEISLLIKIAEKSIKESNGRFDLTKEEPVEHHCDKCDGMKILFERKI